MAVVRRDEVTELLRRRIASGLHLGLLAPGDRLPTVRELAREMDANPRVVLAAYAQLQAEALVEARNRSGFYVPRSGALGGESRKRQTEWLVECLVQAVAHGIPGPALGERLRQATETRRLRAVVADSNDDQLWSIAHELRRDYGMEAVALDLDRAAGDGDVAEALVGADLVVTTWAHKVQVERVAEAAGVPVYVVTTCPGLNAEVRHLLQHHPVYFVVSDARAEARLRSVFADDAPGTPLHVLVDGRDSLDAIPPAAPVYVSRLARERLAGSPVLSRGIPQTRIFSPESSRDLMRFVVDANRAPAGERPRLRRDPAREPAEPLTAV